MLERATAALQHFSKHGVGVVGALIGAQRRVIDNPGKDNDLGVRRLLVAEKEAKLLQELRAEPVLVFVAEGAALSINVAGGVTRDIFERHLQDGRANAPTRTALGTQFTVIRRAPSNYERQCQWDIECFFQFIKQFRGIATRYEKTARNFSAGLQLVCALAWVK